MQLIIGLLILLLNSTASYAQSGFSVAAGTPFFITTSTPVIIDGLALTPSINYTIAGANTLARNTTLTHPSMNRSIQRVFKWSNTLNSYSGDITIYYADGSELNGLAEPDLTLNIHNNTTIWQAYTTGVNRNSVSNFVSTNVSNVNLNELTLASVVLPLPLRWGRVAASRQDATTGVITWYTLEEEGTAFFEVERSIDGAHWSRVGQPVRARNLPGEQFYEQYDATLTKAKTYYRIKQVDSDGSFRYSPVATVGAILEMTGVAVYPNPAYSQVTISAAGAALQSFTLYGSNGQQVVQQSLAAVYNHTLNVQALPAGVYRLQVYLTDGTTSYSSFIKH